MHSSASRAANGMSSAKRACEDPNRSFISEARNEPRASAASWGSVIMYGLKACCIIMVDQWWWVNSGPAATAIPASGAKVTTPHQLLALPAAFRLVGSQPLDNLD